MITNIRSNGEVHGVAQAAVCVKGQCPRQAPLRSPHIIDQRIGRCNPIDVYRDVQSGRPDVPEASALN